MKTNFDTILEATFKEEGGYVDHPSDPGGATNMGITRKTLASWRKVDPYWKLDKSEVKNLTKAEAKEIYKARYWDVVKGDLLPSGIDYVVFDFAVNSGPAKSVKTLQRLVKSDVDGFLGNKTLAAVAEYNGTVLQLIVSFQDERMKFLQGLSTFGVFGKGWKARVDRVTALSKKLAVDVEAKGNDEQSQNDQPKEGAKSNWVGILVAVLGGLLSLWRVFRSK